MAMTPKEIIAVVQHFEAGGEVECREIGAKHPLMWQLASTPIWNFEEFDYRPKPKLLECWMNWYPDGPGSPYANKKDALAAKKDYAEARTVHMREVVDDDQL